MISRRSSLTNRPLENTKPKIKSCEFVPPPLRNPHFCVLDSSDAPVSRCFLLKRVQGWDSLVQRINRSDACRWTWRCKGQKLSNPVKKRSARKWIGIINSIKDALLVNSWERKTHSEGLLGVNEGNVIGAHCCVEFHRTKEPTSKKCSPRNRVWDRLWTGNTFPSSL